MTSANGRRSVAATRRRLASLRWFAYERACRLTREALMHCSRYELYYSLNISRRARFVLVNNPKCGLTTVKSTLRGLDPPSTGAASVHDVNSDGFDRITELPTIRPVSYLVNHGFQFVTTIRNPYDRVASAYRSTIGRHVNPDDPRRARWLRALMLPPDHGPVSFDEFIECICAQSDKQMDPHWRVQTSQIHVDTLPYAFIGRFESFQADLATMLDVIGRPAPTTTIPHTNKSANHDWRASYSRSGRSAIAERYAASFERFGYDTEI